MRNRTPRRNGPFTDYCAAVRHLWRILRHGELGAFLRILRSKERGGPLGALHRLRFRSFERRGLFEPAKQAALAQVRMAPGFAPSHLSLYRACLMLGEEAQADAAMERAAQLMRARLPETLAVALAAPCLVSDAPVRRTALHWAWRHLRRPGDERGAFEREARFGAAAARLAELWFLFAGPQTCEFDALLLPPGDGVERLLVRRNRGVLVLGAHLGCPTAGVRFLRAVSARTRLWSSAPQSRVLGTQEFNLSSERGLALRRVLGALDDGLSVATPLDQDHRGHAVEVCMPGRRKLLLARWIPRLIWKHGIDSVFFFSLWEGDRHRLHVDGGTPRPWDGEPYRAWERRWAEACRAKYLELLRSGPRNLALTGGFWEQF